EEFSIKNLLKKTITGNNMSETEAGQVMEKITEGSITPAQIGSLLTSLTIKGPTVQELTGFARVLYQKARPVPLLDRIDITDTCGTGGDGIGTFNISTAAMFVARGAGVNIAKHGNRSITSRSGSADILETVGIKIDMSPEQAAEALKQTGMCFFFAPHYHPAFKNIMGPRRELGFRTIFNMIGPMLNPGKVKSQIMGVFSPDLTELAAEVLKNLGVGHAFVVHGSDGMDEITLTGKTKITELKDSWIRTRDFDPREYGFSYCSHENLKGGDAKENAEIMKHILDGEKGPHRDIVILNAAAAIVVSDIASDFNEAIQIASKSIDSKEAKKCFEKLIRFSSKL
ncbi:MAG: anthranilate phosphoribosyltransferase, partial [Chitinispirillia bacterium]